MGQVVVITGAASGIGLATAELLLARGGAVVAVDLRGTVPGAETVHGDVCDPEVLSPTWCASVAIP